jgi:acyl-CoA hydrolase
MHDRTIRGSRDDGGLFVVLSDITNIINSSLTIECEVLKESVLGETAILPAASLG